MHLHAVVALIILEQQTLKFLVEQRQQLGGEKIMSRLLEQPKT